MDGQFLIDPALPAASAIAVAREEGGRRVSLVLLDAANRPIAYALISVESGLAISEELNGEVRKLLQSWGGIN